MVKHYHYDCKRVTKRSKLVEIEETTCKHCLERLGLYSINTANKGVRDTSKAKAYFEQQNKNYKKWDELRKYKKGLI